MESGFSSPRHDAFPAGLRVLVVDDDPTWLKILEKMLKKCSYEVTTCGLARDALNLLRQRKDGYDIVISDVNMPDMDGFKLLEHVGLEMDLPVIMMSVDGETSRVMKGVQHGACDYLLKPIRMKELRNIWQHVLRKRIHEGRDFDSLEAIDGLQMTRSGSDRSEDHFFCGEDISSGKKRRELERKHDEKDFSDAGSSAKKARVVWSVDLHQKFVKAVNQIGFDKVGPKRILDLMNVPWLTRENVASHLQKYRLYLTRLQKENEMKNCFGGIKHSETISQDSSASFTTQNSISMCQEDISNRNFRFSGNNLLPQIANSKASEIDRKGIVSVPSEEPERSLITEAPKQQQESSRGVKIGFKQSFGSNVAVNYPWRGIPEVPFKEEANLQTRLESPSHPPKSKCEGANSVEYKPLYTQPSLMSTQRDSSGVQVKDNMAHYQDLQFGPLSLSKLQGQGLVDPLSISGTVIGPSEIGWLQDDLFSNNAVLQNSEFLGYNDPCLVAEVPINLYDAMRYDYEQFMDPTEFSVVNHGLFTA